MKNLKRFFAFALAFVLSFACLLVPSIAEAAEGTFAITITDGETGHNYEAYQVFKGDVTMDGTKKVLTNITWGNGVDGAAIIAALGLDADSTAEDVAKLVATYDDKSDDAMAFAKIVGANIKASGKIQETSDEATHIINVPAEGYYIVMDGDVPAGDVKTAYILQVVSPVEVQIKSEKPTIVKNIIENGEKTKANTASIGEEITYNIESVVPDMTGYDKYFFVVTDTLSPGLTFDPSSLVVSVGGTATEDYMLFINGVLATTSTEAVTPTAATTIKIAFNDFVNYEKGKAVLVEYKATLNHNAVIAGAGNPNEVNLTYSTDPNVTSTGGGTDHPSEPGSGDPVGKTPDDKVVTYTTELVVNKTDGTKVLSGAKFQLTGDTLDVTLVNKEVFVESATGTYYMLKDGTYTETAATTETEKKYDSTTTKYALTSVVLPATASNKTSVVGYTKADGTLTFTGLKAGEYTLTELEAPEGYNKITTEFKLKIDAAATLSGCTWTKGTGTNENFSVSEGTYSIEIINNKGIVLPSTGGMGTTLFYIIGGVLAVGALILLITRRRMSDK